VEVIKLLERANYDALAVAVSLGFLVAPWSRRAARVVGQVCYYPRRADALARNAHVMCALLALPLDTEQPSVTFSAPGSTGRAARLERDRSARLSLRPPWD
jgi:hypothetical protein